jgi:NAD(P)-dependent dehydrogenase (short-subunit alcohol dehydrogenase family)
VLHVERFAELCGGSSGQARLTTVISFDLRGKTAALWGEDGDLHSAIRAALEANGAALSFDSEDQLHLFVVMALARDPPDLVERLCREAADRMTGGGRIVIIAPVAGVLAIRDQAETSVRAASIIALAKGLALEFGKRRVLVNAVAVGALEDGRSSELLSHVPLGRPARLDEVSQAALFLCDPDNSYMTGHVLLLDGGWTAGYARSF